MPLGSVFSLYGLMDAMLWLGRKRGLLSDVLKPDMYVSLVEAIEYRLDGR